MSGILVGAMLGVALATCVLNWRILRGWRMSLRREGIFLDYYQAMCEMFTSGDPSPREAVELLNVVSVKLADEIGMQHRARWFDRVPRAGESWPNFQAVEFPSE